MNVSDILEHLKQLNDRIVLYVRARSANNARMCKVFVDKFDELHDHVCIAYDLGFDTHVFVVYYNFEEYGEVCKYNAAISKMTVHGEPIDLTCLYTKDKPFKDCTFLADLYNVKDTKTYFKCNAKMPASYKRFTFGEDTWANMFADILISNTIVSVNKERFAVRERELCQSLRDAETILPLSDSAMDLLEKFVNEYSDVLSLSKQPDSELHDYRAFTNPFTNERIVTASCTLYISTNCCSRFHEQRRTERTPLVVTYRLAYNEQTRSVTIDTLYCTSSFESQAFDITCNDKTHTAIIMQLNNETLLDDTEVTVDEFKHILDTCGSRLRKLCKLVALAEQYDV